MPRAKFYYGTKGQLDSHAVENGALYLTTDESRWYIDMDDVRHEVVGDSSHKFGTLQITSIGEGSTLVDVMSIKASKTFSNIAKPEILFFMNVTYHDENATIKDASIYDGFFSYYHRDASTLAATPALMENTGDYSDIKTIKDAIVSNGSGYVAYNLNIFTPLTGMQKPAPRIIEPYGDNGFPSIFVQNNNEITVCLNAFYLLEAVEKAGYQTVDPIFTANIGLVSCSFSDDIASIIFPGTTRSLEEVADSLLSPTIVKTRNGEIFWSDVSESIASDIYMTKDSGTTPERRINIVTYSVSPDENGMYGEPAYDRKEIFFTLYNNSSSSIGDRDVVKGLVPQPDGSDGSQILYDYGWGPTPSVSGGDLTGIVPVSKGGTGADTAAEARTNLGITPGNIGAAAASHTHPYAGSSTPGGAATSANKLTTARTLSLGGDASGSTTFDGSANVTIDAVVLNHDTTEIPENADLDEYTNPGWYRAGTSSLAASLKNSPTKNAFSLEVTEHAGWSQLITEYNITNPKKYYRNFYFDGTSRTWGQWYRIYTEADKPTPSEIGAANSSHTHTTSQISGLDNTLNDLQEQIDSLEGTSSADISSLTQQIANLTNSKQDKITGAATTITANNLTANRAVVSDASGKVTASVVTSTELGYLDGVTSNVQTQLNGKAPTSHSHVSTNITGDASSVAVFDATGVLRGSSNISTGELDMLNGVTSNIQTQLNGKAATEHNHSGADITSGSVAIAHGGTGATTAAQARTNLGINLANLGVTASAAELNKLDGATVSVTEINYLDGVTSNVQTQLNGKAATDHNHAAGDITSGTFVAARIPNLDASKITSGTLAAARIPSLDASKITSGTISIDRLPQGALERLVVVANDTARFDLTTSQVQNGDVVKVEASGKMYFVKDQNELDNANGYEEFAAGTAASVSWNNITGKPSTFTPSSHTHPYAGSASAGGPANSVANALTISLNGTSQGAYNGSAAKSVNVTPASIGAATSGHTHNAVTTSTAGFMSAADKQKLDNLENYIETYELPKAGYGSYGVVKLHQGQALNDHAGLYINENGALAVQCVSPISLTAAGNVNLMYTSPLTKDSSGNLTISPATTSSPGSMSAADKQKLDGISASADVNQNAWSTIQANTTNVTAASTTDSIRFIPGSNVSITGNNTDKTVTISATNTTYGVATGSANGLMSAADKAKLDGITSSADSVAFSRSLSSGTKVGTITINGTATDLYAPTNTDTTYDLASTTANGLLRKLSGSTSQFMRGDGTWATPPNTTYSAMKGSTTSAAGSSGLVPAPAAGAATRYLRCDGTWVVPPDTNTNTTYTLTKSGSTITLTGSDGSKTSVTDANTTYSLSSFGITATAAELNKLDGVTATATEINYLDGVTSSIQTQLNGKAASSHTHNEYYSSSVSRTANTVLAAPNGSNGGATFRKLVSADIPSLDAGKITSGTLPVARGGTGVTSNPSMLVNLGSTSAASVFTTSPRPGITGTLAISHGGTGGTTVAAAHTNLKMNRTTVGNGAPTSSDATAGDIYIDLSTGTVYKWT